LAGRRRKDWFGHFLELPNGIPSQHTFWCFFERLDPLALQHVVAARLHRAEQTLGLRHIAVDGKTLRQSKGGASPLHDADDRRRASAVVPRRQFRTA
jgi:hypothetical protein